MTPEEGVVGAQLVPAYQQLAVSITKEPPDISACGTALHTSGGNPQYNWQSVVICRQCIISRLLPPMETSLWKWIKVALVETVYRAIMCHPASYKKQVISERWVSMCCNQLRLVAPVLTGLTSWG